MFSRSLPLMLVASLLPAVAAGCDLDLGLDEPLFSCENPPLPGDCVDERDPFAFTSPLDGHEALALGAESRINTLVHDSLPRYRIRSSDPDVVSIEIDGDDNVIVRGLAEGVARIEALPPDENRVLDSVSVPVAPVAATDFFYYPVGGRPLPELAGLVGSADTLHAVHYSADGETLATADIVEYAAEGALELDGEAEPRWSDFVRGFNGQLLGDPLVVTFTDSAPGELVARTPDGGAFSLPVRGVSAADAHAIEPDDELVAGRSHLLFLRSRTADGVTVAGVRGRWSVEPAGRADLTTLVDPASEATVEATSGEAITVLVEVGETRVSQELEVLAAD
jgi:hypothetical protein